MTDRLAAIEKRLREATQGPWEVKHEGSMDYPRGTTIHAAWTEPVEGCVGYGVAKMWGVNDKTLPNAALIANAPSDLRYLLDQLKAHTEAKETKQ